MATEKRLIDANAYVDELKWLQEQVSSSSAIEIQEYIDRTNRQPTVDAVEVVHGRWVIEKRHTVSRNPYMDDNYHANATCSECDFCIDSSNGSFGFPELNTTNYCPNCGADMRGDGNGT